MGADAKDEEDVGQRNYTHHRMVKCLQNFKHSRFRLMIPNLEACCTCKIKQITSPFLLKKEKKMEEEEEEEQHHILS